MASDRWEAVEQERSCDVVTVLKLLLPLLSPPTLRSVQVRRSTNQGLSKLQKDFAFGKSRLE